ncbi:MAG: tetratricopeptide repeat protein, partial [Microcystaceae cyanobacterium]
QAWQLEGRIYQALQRYPEALNAYNEALARDPQNGEIWRQQAAVLERMGQYSQAVASNTWAIQLMPEDRLTLTQQCTLLNLVTQNQTPPAPEGYTKALASCEQALQKGTGDWNELGAAYAWNQRGNALTGLGRNEEAIVSFQQAIALQPTYGEAWRNISVAFWNLEQYDQALSALDQAIKLNPSDSQAWFNRGRILTEQNQYAQAIMAYDQALLGDINNRSSSAKALLWLNQSAVFWQLQQYQFALEATEKALAVNPDQPTQIKALYNQGLALIGLQNYTEAEEIFKKVLEISPDNDNQAAKDGLKFIQQQTTESANSI